MQDKFHINIDAYSMSYTDKQVQHNFYFSEFSTEDM